MIKEFLKKFIPYPLLRYKRKLMAEIEFRNWEKSGKPIPPPHIVKQKIILSYKNKYRINTLIETGTCYGEMVEALRKDFQKIISIEISKELFNYCKDRFKSSDNVTLYNGDSGLLLPDILNNLTTPCIFWLDGHYSGDETGKGELNTPIFKELRAILETKMDHVILIDDARLFVGKEDYPTLPQLKEFVNSYDPNYEINVADDAIRIFKGK